MRVRMGLACALAAATLGGCAGIPDSGPVERVVAATSRTHSTVRYEPARPRAGATPSRIVDGYLDAMLAYPEATGIVHAFLTPQAAKDWQSNGGVTVYSSAIAGLRSASGGGAQVTLRVREVMSIDSSGRASVEPAVTTRILQLARVDGQWRIDNPGPGYLVSQTFARDYVRSYPLWFFDSSGQRLVPELVHAVVSEQLPLTLINRLAAGPRGSTRRTYLPAADQLRVRLTGTVAEVDLRRPANGTEDKIVAQLLSTLRGVPGLDAVRVLVNGKPDGEDHPLDAVVGFGPGAPTTKVYALRGNRVVDATTRIKAIKGPWGRSARRAVDMTVDSDEIAAVLPGRTTVAVGARAGGVVSSYTGTDFVRPIWDNAHRLWLVDNPSEARIRVLDGPAMVDVDSGGLGTVESFALSPEGTRYAAVVEVAKNDARAVVGEVVRDTAGFPRRLGPGQLVSRGLSGERQIGWASQSRVEFIADTSNAAQLYSVGIDGADRSVASGSSALAGGVTAWAGPPSDSADRWALDQRGRVWKLPPGESWRPVAGTTGRGALHGLSSGR